MTCFFARGIHIYLGSDANLLVVRPTAKKRLYPALHLVQRSL